MRILLTNNTLDFRAGSELYVLDIARELQKRGHQPVAFSQQQGTVAASLRESGIPVVDDPRKIVVAPDVIHGHHHIETLIALTSLPGVPAISFCHGWAPWQEAPLQFPRVLRYVAVDQPCWEKLVLENGIPSGKVELLFNFVDTACFQGRSALPTIPRRALAFGNYFSPGPTLEPLQKACGDLGIQLDVVGISCGYSHPAPEQLLTGYDLVFAKARSALEAMAVGAAVVLCGPQGLGPLVAPDNWKNLRGVNFGFRSLNLPLTAEQVTSQIRLYDAEAATEVRDRVRSEATLTDAVDRLCGLYEEVVREGETIPPDLAAESTAVAEYMLRWAPRYKQWEFAGDQEDLIRQRTHAEKAATEARSELSQRSAELAEVRSRHASEVEQASQKSDVKESELIGRIESLTAERDHWRSSHDAISQSATWRLAQSGLQSGLVRAVATPLVERLGAFLRRTLPDRHGKSYIR